MKFLIDAQLPKSLKQLFLQNGYACIHTLDLQVANNTPDKVINKISIEESRILITKDSDFFQSFIIKNQPYKLIFVKLGNTSKNDLLRFFAVNFSVIISQIEKEDVVLLKRKF